MVAKAKKTRKRHKNSIAQVVRQALQAGKTNVEILEMVKAQFPESKVQAHSISWYRTKMRQEGIPTLSNFGARSLQKKMQADQVSGQQDNPEDVSEAPVKIRPAKVVSFKTEVPRKTLSGASKKSQTPAVIPKTPSVPAVTTVQMPVPILDYRAIAMDHVRVVASFFERYHQELFVMAKKMADMFAQGNCLFFCGNGGSACDAMHMAGEFVGRFKRERRALPAMALSSDSGILTALANDYDFTRIFARQLEGFAQADDMLIALSTSGRSPNILAALETAREFGVTTVLFTGRKGAELAAKVDYGFVVDSEDTARIQECYMTALHALAEGVEITL